MVDDQTTSDMDNNSTAVPVVVVVTISYTFVFGGPWFDPKHFGGKIYGFKGQFPECHRNCFEMGKVVYMHCFILTSDREL